MISLFDLSASNEAEWFNPYSNIVKFEKYVIVAETGLPSPMMKIRFGFGAAGEEVQKLLDMQGVQNIRVRIDGTKLETVFPGGRPWRLLDIKQRLKGLTLIDD